MLFFRFSKASLILLSLAATRVQGYATAQNPNSARSYADKFSVFPLPIIFTKISATTSLTTFLMTSLSKSASVKIALTSIRTNSLAQAIALSHPRMRESVLARTKISRPSSRASQAAWIFCESLASTNNRLSFPWYDHIVIEQY
jgi:hypothetical protein